LPHPVPFGYSATPTEWLQCLEKAERLSFTTLIPGHGEVQKDKKYLQTVIGLLQSLSSQIEAAIAKGLSVEEARAAIDIALWETAITKGDGFLQYYFNQYFKVPIVTRFYNEIKGK
jgi:cyclase